MGLYGDKDLYNWFIAEFPKYSKTKLDISPLEAYELLYSIDKKYMQKI